MKIWRIWTAIIYCTFCRSKKVRYKATFCRSKNVRNKGTFCMHKYVQKFGESEPQILHWPNGKITFLTGPRDPLWTLVTGNLRNLRTLDTMGNFFQQVPEKSLIAMENVCFVWINMYVKCWELSVNNAFGQP